MRKKLFKTIILLFILIFSLLLVSCGKKNEGVIEPGFNRYDLKESDSSYAPSEGFEPYGDYSKYTFGELIGDEGVSVKNQGIGSHLLTASAIFDNEDYDYWKSLLVKGQEIDGEFKLYQDEFKLSMNRIRLTLKGVGLAKVMLLDNENKVEWTSYSDKNGIVYLFNNEIREKYNVIITYKNESNEDKELKYEVVNNQVIEINEKAKELNTIQLMVVLDTTGSMGDEINYLTQELKSVIQKVEQENDCNILLSLMLYRDYGDDYVTKYFDFTENIDSIISELSKQSADGGGDFEEAVQAAFYEANEKQWESNPSTKIILHVADAPSHNQDVNKWFESVKNLASKGVRIINVASSGIDKLTEFLFRSECIQTNGCYAHLTNHSGIGGSHIDATTDKEEIVEYLDDLLVRVIGGMYSGTYKAAVPYISNNTNQNESNQNNLEKEKN